MRLDYLTAMSVYWLTTCGGCSVPLYCPHIEADDGQKVCVAPPPDSHIEFLPILEEFDRDFSHLYAKKTDIKIVWSNLPRKIGAVGLCFNPLSLPSWIEIDEVSKASSDFELKNLVYHELGHCRLGLEHSDDPTDIMYPYLDLTTEEEFDRSLTRMKREAYAKLMLERLGSVPLEE